MNRAPFVVYSRVVNDEGDTLHDGWEDESISLRDAIDNVHATRTNRVDGVESIEADCSHGRPRWVTVSNGMEFETGCRESRSLHIPDWVSASSARRIARLIGATVRA